MNLFFIIAILIIFSLFVFLPWSLGKISSKFATYIGHRYDNNPKLYRCPQCGQNSITGQMKNNLGPFNSASCPNCHMLVGFSNWAILYMLVFVFIPGFVALWFGLGVLPIFIIFLLGVLIWQTIQVNFTPLVKK